MESVRKYLAEDQIRERIRELGQQINSDYQGQAVMLVGVLKGSFVFLSDLCRELDPPAIVDFVAISSYGHQTKSTGQVRFLSDLSIPIKGKHVIVVEDIVDTGLTLKYLLENLQSREPASLKICSFLSKPSRRKVEISIDYLGFEVPDEFVVGYGLDFDQRYRNLPYLGILSGVGDEE